MAGLFDNIRGGLRDAGGILSGQVYAQNKNEDMMLRSQANNADAMIVEQTLKAMSDGLMPKEQGMPVVLNYLKSKGASPELMQSLSPNAFGPSAETQQGLLQKQQDERIHQMLDQDELGKQIPRDMFPNAQDRVKAYQEAKKQPDAIRTLQELQKNPELLAMKERLAKAGAPSTTIQNIPKLETGFMPVDPNDLTKGVMPIPGGSKDTSAQPRSTAEASAISNAYQAAEDLKTAKDILFKDGKFDRAAAATGIGGGVPNTKGRTARQAIRRAVEVLLRARTGAAAPQQEVDSYVEMYSPSALDNDEQAALKMQRAEQFFSDTLSLLKAEPQKEEITDADIKETARKNNMTEDEVRAKLKEQGRL